MQSIFCCFDNLISLTFSRNRVICSFKDTTGKPILLFESQHHESTTCLYEEGLSCSSKNSQYGIIFPFSVINLDLRLIPVTTRQTKYRKSQFDGVVGWCCDDPRTMHIVLGATGVDEPTGSVNSKKTCFRIDNCKQKCENQCLTKLTNFTLLTS